MIKRGATITGGEWVGQVSLVMGGTVVGSPKGVNRDHPLYASRAWPASMVVQTRTGCYIDKSRACTRSYAAPAKRRSETAAAKIAREQSTRATWNAGLCTLN
jgi:hypothetical protein